MTPFFFHPTVTVTPARPSLAISPPDPARIRRRPGPVTPRASLPRHRAPEYLSGGQIGESALPPVWAAVTAQSAQSLPQCPPCTFYSSSLCPSRGPGSPLPLGFSANVYSAPSLPRDASFFLPQRQRAQLPYAPPSFPPPNARPPPPATDASLAVAQRSRSARSLGLASRESPRCYSAIPTVAQPLHLLIEAPVFAPKFSPLLHFSSHIHLISHKRPHRRPRVLHSQCPLSPLSLSM
ncbi:hypothetical protein C8Q78DRAFT_1021054 [Trametes maxima]|nr:hypothetical protein C8Q78DRAFT_1021054 [Trametes maxima]